MSAISVEWLGAAFMALHKDESGVKAACLGVDAAGPGAAPLGHVVGIEVDTLDLHAARGELFDPWQVPLQPLTVGGVHRLVTERGEPVIVFLGGPEVGGDLRGHHGDLLILAPHDAGLLTDRKAA